ncbi:tetratricopeptide repeat protein [Paenisporosarcina sp. TG20]|uniref:tetratricopeptide repeat protein n=1 Tax=Paenisporosarcina sp. TG20 TaxID=1211706 RepID=UPI0002FE48FC|nr:tetratricopeptide repeat protein [Paenisporosarcina sp. TG20]
MKKILYKYKIKNLKGIQPNDYEVIVNVPITFIENTPYSASIENLYEEINSFELDWNDTIPKLLRDEAASESIRLVNEDNEILIELKLISQQQYEEPVDFYLNRLLLESKKKNSSISIENRSKLVNHLSKIYEIFDQHENAMKIVEEENDENPNNYLLTRYAKLLRINGNLPLSLEMFIESFYRYPGGSASLKGLATTLSKQNRKGLSHDIFKEALKIELKNVLSKVKHNNIPEDELIEIVENHLDNREVDALDLSKYPALHEYSEPPFSINDDGDDEESHYEDAERQERAMIEIELGYEPFKSTYQDDEFNNHHMDESEEDYFDQHKDFYKKD